MFATETIPVSLYSWQDSGVPTLSASAGSLKNLLKAILVTGYGDKEPLGWEMPFESPNVAVFRSKAEDSNRHYLRVDNTGIRYANMAGYIAMSGLDSGTDIFKYNNNYDRFGYLYSGKTATRGWWLVGHRKAFTFVVTTTYESTPYLNNESAMFYFGDVPTVVPQDTGNTIYLASNQNYEYYGSYGLDLMNESSYLPALFARSWDASAVRQTAALHSLGVHKSNRAVYPDRITGGTWAAPIYLMESGADYYNLRGLLPGWYKASNNLKDLRDGAVLPLDGTDDQFLKFNLRNAADDAHFLLNTSHWQG